MSNFITLLLILLLVSGCGSTKLAEPRTVFDRASGTWDEDDPDKCWYSHTIAFTENKDTMIITYPLAGQVTETDLRKDFNYSIVNLNESEIYAFLEDEPRLTETGDPVIWIFRMIDDDNYCWGRADWPVNACTPKRMRCIVQPPPE